MTNYLLRRLCLIPLTLFAILLVNFVIIGLAPGDPSTIASGAMDGDGTRRAGQEAEWGRDDQYLLFREHYGLTLPVLFNRWPSVKRQSVEKRLRLLAGDTLAPKASHALRLKLGDQSRYLLPTFLDIAEDSRQPTKVRQLALRLFVRGATRGGHLGPGLSPEQRVDNRQIAKDNQWLRSQLEGKSAGVDFRRWLEIRAQAFPTSPSLWQKMRIFFGETRFSRYFTRVLTLDFGTLRDDANRTVIREVGRRIKVSLTLAVAPMLITFVLCQALGMFMALKQNRWPDLTVNFLLLALYAVPIFVVAPFLIEKVALPHDIPFSGFHSESAAFGAMTSWHRLQDIALHIFLPLVAIMYGTLAAQARLSRTAMLEVLRQDYVRTARAKGLPPLTILWKHVGRNAAITIVTSLAASLGVVLGGSLIVETIFDIDGFGRFFYHAILNRDYNVIMFSALAGSGLALIGYLAADIAYTFLDPRVSLS